MRRRKNHLVNGNRESDGLSKPPHHVVKEHAALDSPFLPYPDDLVIVRQIKLNAVDDFRTGLIEGAGDSSFKWFGVSHVVDDAFAAVCHGGVTSCDGDDVVSRFLHHLGMRPWGFGEEGVKVVAPH
ncbi:MAG: hypothetical protein M2R46_04828 [Verrucomicrobia subdivision 3 bacterium]|nr:hypothetical protein [Limisphaerales bacterium]